MNKVSADAQYAFITSRISQCGAESVDTLKMFIQMFSAIVGGSIGLSVGAKIEPLARQRYVYLSNALVGLLLLITVGIIADNLRSWFKHRKTQSFLVGLNDKQKPIVPKPSLFWDSLKEAVMIAGLVAACALFWAFNPFGV